MERADWLEIEERYKRADALGGLVDITHSEITRDSIRLMVALLEEIWKLRRNQP